MKIALLIPELALGGAERQVELLARRLPGLGHEVLVLVFYPGGELESRLDPSTCKLVSLDKRGRSDVLGFLLRLWRTLRRERPDVIMSFLGVPNMALSLLSPLLPGQRTILGVMGANPEKKSLNWLGRLCLLIEPRVARLADAAMSNSWAGMNDAVAVGFPKDMFHVVPNGVDIGYFQHDAEGRRRCRKEWGVGEGELLIGLPARFGRQKDHPTFLQAASLLAARRPKARFVCIGKGTAEETVRLHALSDELGLDDRLIWAGPRMDMPAALSALDIGCLSSSYGEGLSNAVLEMMACGAPCVVTDVADTPAAVEGVGEVCPPRDPEALALALDRLAGRLESEGPILQEACRRRIVERYSLDAHMQRVEAMLQEVAAKGRR